MIEFSYIHIPFCNQKCKYCAFVSFVNLNLIEDYIEALLFQIKKKYDDAPQKTLYFGGGTPSLLNLKQLEKIINNFNFQNNPEITIEINPENSSLDYLKGLKELGFNRLSVGIQTFSNETLKSIGRRHSSTKALSTIEDARKAGFKNVSIDLMYGLPNQTIKDWEHDLEIANNLNIEHISTYGLKIEDKTYFKKYPPKSLPDEDLQADMHKFAIKKLKNFKLYEISNFAKSENFYSKHNLNYWQVDPYNAFGVSASGFDGKIRYKNTENLKKYLSNPLLVEEIFELTRENLIEETIFLGFRTAQGINISQIEEKFDFNFNQKYGKIRDKYLKTGHLEKTKKGYKLTEDGILISNYILSDFLW